MKISDKDSNHYEQEINKIKEFVGDEDKVLDLFVTCLGTSQLFSEYIIEHVQSDPSKLPVKVQYSMVLFAQIMGVVAMVVKGTLKKENTPNFQWMPTTPDAWQTEKDFEKRLILLVTTLHDNLKKEGKI